MIGEFLGKDREYNIDVLNYFISELEFKGVYFVEALRIML